MVLKHLVGLAVGHKAALIFAGGVATAVVGKKVLESGIVKDAATNAMAGVISMKQDAEKAVEEMKADAEEMVNEQWCVTMVLRTLVGLTIGTKATVLFTGGVAAVVIGKKVLESDIVKDTASTAMAEVMSIKNDAEKLASDMKADAEEIVVEAKE